MSVPSQELKNLHPSVQAVADVNAVVLINMDIHWQVELARVLPKSAHEHQHLAVGSEDLEIVEGGVHHPQVAFLVKGQALRADEFSGACALPPDAAHELQISGEYFHRATSR